MALNLIKRKVSISDLPLLHDVEEVFYIVWHRDDKEYFFIDCSEDNTSMLWSEDKTKAIKFNKGDEALEIMNDIKKTRKGPGIIELKIITEETEESIWMI